MITMAKKKKISRCCGAETYEAPQYYCTTMKTAEGTPIPMEDVCLKCGKRCSLRRI